MGDAAFYRLRQLEPDGTGSVSSIVKADCGTDVGMRFWPNPVVEKGSLSIESPGRASARISLIATNGRTIRVQNRELSAGENLLELDFSSVPRGAYWLVAELESGKILAQQVVK